jgi:translocator protein
MTHIYWELGIYVWFTVFFIGFALPFVFYSSREMTSGLYKSLTRPAWAPPPFVFGVVWFILYTAQAIAYTIVRLHSDWKGNVLIAGLIVFWLLQIALMLWTPLVRCSLGWSWLSVFISLILAIIDTILFFSIEHISQWAGWLMVALDVWLLFALLLASVIWYYNRNVDLCQRCDKLRVTLVPE